MIRITSVSILALSLDMELSNEHDVFAIWKLVCPQKTAPLSIMV